MSSQPQNPGFFLEEPDVASGQEISDGGDKSIPTTLYNAFTVKQKVPAELFSPILIFNFQVITKQLKVSLTTY